MRTNREEGEAAEIGQTGSPGVSTAYMEDVLIDGHPLDIPLPTAEPPPEVHLNPAPQENAATNIPRRPGQRIYSIQDQPPILTGNQIIAVNNEPLPLVDVLAADFGTLIIAHDKPQFDLAATRDDATLKAIGHLYNHLKYVSKALGAAIDKKSPYVAEKEAIQWLYRLNRLTSSILPDYERPIGFAELQASAAERAATANISVLIQTEFNIDVRLPYQPHAQRRRTDVLLQRLVWCDGPLFKALLSELFGHARRSAGVVDHRTFIDLQHLALSALSVFNRRFPNDAYGTDVYLTKDLLKHITECAVPDLSPKQLAAFIAEVTICYRRNSHNPFELLDHYFPEPSDATRFVREACLFLNEPWSAPNELRETMMAHLEEDDTSWSSSNVQLVEALARLGDPAEGVAPLSDDQRIRVQRMLTRYMEALNAMHTDIQMSAVRKNLLRLPHIMLVPAFGELSIYDKFKIVGIILDPRLRNGLKYYLAELDEWLPMIRTLLSDRSIPIGQRNHLVNEILTELARNVPDDMSVPAVFELIQLRDDLARIAEYQGN